MSKFITGKDLVNVIDDIIWEAKETLLLVSPYIKLDNYFKNLFNKHKHNHSLHILVVFGKNENDIKKSFSKDDFDFFKDFLNVSVVYVPNLHAKYYGNESKGVITSINLYDFSFKNNIEFGVYSESTLLGNLASMSNISTDTDSDAWKTSIELAEKNQVVFIKRPVYEKKLLSAITGKNYIKSEVLYDETESFYKGKPTTKDKKLKDFLAEIDLGADKNSVRPTREENEIGYCIRTGVQIPFDIKKPYCDAAYKSWAIYKNPTYKEKYCHKTGQPSNGKTNMKNPIL